MYSAFFSAMLELESRLPGPLLNARICLDSVAKRLSPCYEFRESSRTKLSPSLVSLQVQQY